MVRTAIMLRMRRVSTQTILSRRGLPQEDILPLLPKWCKSWVSKIVFLPEALLVRSEASQLVQEDCEYLRLSCNPALSRNALTRAVPDKCFRHSGWVSLVANSGLRGGGLDLAAQSLRHAVCAVNAWFGHGVGSCGVDPPVFWILFGGVGES